VILSIVFYFEAILVFPKRIEVIESTETSAALAQFLWRKLGLTKNPLQAPPPEIGAAGVTPLSSTTSWLQSNW
jgi:hypothetical protein